MSGENGDRPSAGEPTPLRLGGMALRNGLLIHGPTSWAAAARAADGSIQVVAGRKPTLGNTRVGKIPGVRGPLRMAEAMAVVPIARIRLRSVRLPFEDPRVLVAAAASMALGAVGRRWVARSGSTKGAAAREGALSLLGMLPAVAALRDRDLAAYHGVEHKAIGAYEKGSRDPSDAPKEHDRCGSNLIVPLLVFSAAGQAAIERLFTRPGPVVRAAASTGAMSAAVEVFAYADRKPGSALGRGVHAVGHEIQRVLSTREPTPEQIEVGVAALDAVLAEEEAAGEPAAGK